MRRHDPGLPALLIVGMLLTVACAGEDAGVPADVMRRIHEVVRGSHFIELAQAGHISNIEQPVEFNKAVGEFLSAPLI